MLAPVNWPRLSGARIPASVMVVATLAFSAIGFIAVVDACKPRYALCESSRDCAPNACVAGRCVPGQSAFQAPGVGVRDAGALAIARAERHVLAPAEVSWSGATPGRFARAGDTLRIHFAPWAFPFASDAGPVHARIEEAYLLLHRADRGTTDRATLQLFRVATGTTGSPDPDDGLAGDGNSPRWGVPIGAEVRVDALAPPWVRLDAIPLLRGISLKSGLDVQVSARDAAGEGVAFYVQSLTPMGPVGDSEFASMSPMLELYVTTELLDAGAGNDAGDAATDGGRRSDGGQR